MSENIIAKDICWKEVGKRIIKLRELWGLSRAEFADKLELGEANLSCWENGMERKTIGVLPALCQKIRINLEWMLTGKGQPFRTQHEDDVIDPLKIDKGNGIRKSKNRKDIEDGIFDEDLLEFVKAVDSFKSSNKRPFPTLSEVYTIMLYLGYRKVEEKQTHIDCVGD